MHLWTSQQFLVMQDNVEEFTTHNKCGESGTEDGQVDWFVAMMVLLHCAEKKVEYEGRVTGLRDREGF